MPAETGGTRHKRLRSIVVTVMALLLASCSVSDEFAEPKIALLAPFEGQFREIGYNAYYALQLAIADAAISDAQLLAVDDGGTVESAIARVEALNLDPAVATVIALGPAATHDAVQMVNDKPMILVGNWGHDRADADSFYAASAAHTRDRRADDLLMLEQVRALRDDLGAIRLRSSGSLADAEFSARYTASAESAPQPNLLASLTYDVARFALAALDSGADLSQTTHRGLNGLIQFEAGYWKDAPLKSYRYENDRMVYAPD